MGHGERKVALSGDSVLFHYGPHGQQLADEGQLAANVYFVAGGRCAPVPGVIERDYFAHCANMPGILASLVRRENVRSVVLSASWPGYRDKGMLIEREGRRLALDTKDGHDAFLRQSRRLMFACYSARAPGSTWWRGCPVTPDSIPARWQRAI
jgi:hypothetical protein